MLNTELYERYLDRLLNGDRVETTSIVTKLLDDGITIKELYIDLLQRSMYEVGTLWESNQISVAVEHLASAITADLLRLTYPRILEASRVGKRAVLGCTPGEYHQLGCRMAADLLEFAGWDVHFLGASTPEPDLLNLIEDSAPDLLGLSMTVYFNLPSLRRLVHAVQERFSELEILIGGQAFREGADDVFAGHAGVELVTSLDRLEELASQETCR